MRMREPCSSAARRAIVPIALAAALGCSSSSSGPPPPLRTTPAERLARAGRNADQNLRSLPLPPARDPSLPPMPPLPRVLVMREGIDVENAAWTAAWTAGERDAFLRRFRPEQDEVPVVRRNVATYEGWAVADSDLRGGARGLVVGPVLRSLEAIRDIEKDFARITGHRRSGELALYVVAGTPWHLVERIVFTAQQAEYRRFRLALAGPHGHVVSMAFETPRLCDSPPAGSSCLLARVVLQRTGVMVYANESISGAQCLPGRRADAAGPAPPWAGRVVLAHDGVCPSVPLSGQQVDRAALTGLLGAMTPIAPACGHVVVAAHIAAKAEQVAALLEAVHAASDEIWLPVDPDIPPVAICDGGAEPRAMVAP